MPTVTPAPRNSRVRHPQTREQAYGWLAARFTDYGWRPEEMRLAESMFLPATPVADAMERQQAGAR